MRLLIRTFCFLVFLAFWATSATAADTNLSPQLNLMSGYQEMYNLEFGTAHQIFETWQQVHPDDPLGYVSDGAAYLFSEFNRLHVLESELFTDDQKFESRTKLSPDPAAKIAFDRNLNKTEQLANATLAHSPQDSQALFALVLANGLRGDYAAMIEKRNMASLRYMKTSRGIAEKLLTVDPTCYDAYLAVGVENYLLGVNPAPIRWFLRLGGAETDKDGGLVRLRLTAEKGHYLAPFARLLLAVAALRDKDRNTARNLLQGLAMEFPENRLYAKELARIPQ